MTPGEKNISENLKLMDLKRDRLRQSILTLSASWNDLEDNLVSAEKTFEEETIELDAREDGLYSFQNSIAESMEEVELSRNSEESFREELLQREANFSVYEQERMEYFRTREKLVEDMFENFRWSVQEWIKEADMKQEKLEFARESIGRISREFDNMEDDYKSRSKELDDLQNLVKKRLNKLNDEEKQFEGRLNKLFQKEKEVEVLGKIYKECTENFNVKEKELQERSKELDLIQKQNEASRKEIELKIKEFDTKKNQFDSFKASFDMSCQELEEKIKKLDLEREELVEKSNDVEKTSNLLEQKGKEIEVERRLIKKRKRNFKIKEKLLTNTINSRVKVEKVDEMPLINGSPASVSFTITMDGKNLQLFLNENSNHLDSMCEEVLKVLQLSTDPSMLVLDAMEGFYPPHLSKGDKMFETSVLRNTCIILLQQLGKISPPILSEAKNRALKLAEEWKNKINLTDCNSLEVFGLLHLLASYGLAADFGSNDVIKLLNLVAEDDQVFELCRLPGFADKIPDLIKQFIEQSRFILAVRFICKLDLADKFPPVPLLKNYINFSKKIPKDLGQGQKKAIDERITSLKVVMGCIVELNLQSQYPPEPLQICIDKLIKKKVDGANEALISESQNLQDGSSSTVTNNKEECRKLKQSLSRKKRHVQSLPSRASKRRFVSSSAADAVATSSIHNPFIQFRPPNRGYFPIATASQSSFSHHHQDPTVHIAPNPQLWRYGPGMSSSHSQPHFLPFAGINRDSAGPMLHGWPIENHFHPNYHGRRY